MTSATIVFHLTRQTQGQAELADFAEILLMRFDSGYLMKHVVHMNACSRAVIAATQTLRQTGTAGVPITAGLGLCSLQHCC